MYKSSCGGKTLELRGCSRERYQEHKDVRLKDFNFNTNSEDRRLALCSQKEKWNNSFFQPNKVNHANRTSHDFSLS